MTNQITLHQQYAFGALQPEDVKTIQETIAKDCNESQFRLFMTVAKSMDANPINQEIYPTVYQGKLTWQFGIDYFIRKAKEHPQYRGHDAQVVRANDIYKVVRKRGEDGRYYDDFVHEWEGERGPIIKAYALAYKEGFQPYMVEMEISEVEHLQNSAIGMQKTMWKNNLGDMFKKHVLKRALKAAFNINSDDDNSEVVDSTPDPYVRKDITTEAEANQPKQTVVDPPKQTTTTDAPKEDFTDRWLQVGDLLDQLGHTTKPAKSKYINAHFKTKGDAPTHEDFNEFIKLIQMEVAEKEAGDDIE